MRPVLLALPLALGLLAGCGSDPADEVRAQVAALTDAANAGDADRVRERVDALLSTVEAQRDALGGAEADRLTALATSVRTNADVIDTDLLERRRAEAEAEAAAQQLAEAKRQLEQERRKAEEAARQADDGKGKGKGGDDDKDEDDD
ncbi:MAG: hypothetical protein JWM62_2464 [Frankiales bacterium]|jgi:hypothetical protein|nr:hypothetical protein [Frankiales bacterium]